MKAVTPFFRIAQCALYIGQKFVKYRRPLVIESGDFPSSLISVLKANNIYRPFFVTGPNIYKKGLCEPYIKALKENGLSPFIFTDTKSNPTFDEIYVGRTLAKKNNCDCIIVLGGGSVIDTGKLIGVLLKSLRKSLHSFRGILTVHHPLPFFVSIPTTAGSGSEASISAVVTNPKTHQKFAVSSPQLVSDVILLDPSLLVKCPKKTIAESGMDAMSHALESYLSRYKNGRAASNSLFALRLISENLLDFYHNPTLDKASLLLKASMLSGEAISVNYVGYVHALAHALGGKTNLSHGKLIAAFILPVFRSYGEKAYDSFERIHDALSLGSLTDTKKEKVERVLAFIEDFIRALGLSLKLPITLNNDEIKYLARAACKEANPIYPVPKILTAKELEGLIREVVNVK